MVRIRLTSITNHSWKPLRGTTKKLMTVSMFSSQKETGNESKITPLVKEKA